MVGGEVAVAGVSTGVNLLVTHHSLKISEEA